ncbi:MAG: chemotaxis protein CheW, partial [Roseiflexaceae bacterium]|nr:chemotaxis protein CheW [Roseiflexaceae bacterium]
MTGVRSDFAGQTDQNILLIRLADEIYALPSVHVREVGRYRAFTPVPGAPPILPGIISQRGVILPVVDLRLVLGMPAMETTRSSRLVTVVYEDIDMALLVDAV